MIPILEVPRRLQGRADGVLRQHRVGDAGVRPGHAPALPAHDEPAQPREPRGVSAPPRLQPPEPLPAARRLPQAPRRARGLRGAPLRPHRADDLDRPGRPWRPPSRACPGCPCPCRRCRPSCRRPRRGITQSLIDRINQFAFPVNNTVPAPAVQEAGQLHDRRRVDALPAPQGQVARSVASAAVSRVLERIVQAAGRRPGRVLLAVALVAGISAALALRLEPSTATETLVGKSSGAYRATEVYRERFGDHAIIVLVRGDLQRLVLTDNLGRLLGLEGCLSGNKPKDEPAPGGKGSPCAEFARTKPVKVVYGPGTFINSAVGEINDQFQQQLGSKAQEAERAKVAARKLAKAQGRSKAEQNKAAEVRRAARLRAVHARPAPAQPALRARPQGAAAARRPRLRLDAGVRPGARRDDAEGALRLPVPELALRRHPGAPQARPLRGAAAARDRARARRRGDEGVAADRAARATA